MWVTAIISAFKSRNKKYVGEHTKTEGFTDHQRQHVDMNHGRVWMRVLCCGGGGGNQQALSEL